MKPLDTARASLVAQWLEKANKDLAAAEHLLSEGPRHREAVGYLSQQAAEKYLKALLVDRSIEFPKTHDIRALLKLAELTVAGISQRLQEAEFLNPFGVDVRYPGDSPDMLPGDELHAAQLAREVRDTVQEIMKG